MLENAYTTKYADKNYLGFDPGSRLQMLDDFFGGTGNWSGQRAGIATQLAKAQGKTPSFNLKHPVTSEALGALLYGGGGAIAGEALVHGGGGLGAAGGVLFNWLKNAISRRNEMKGIFDDYKKGVRFKDNPKPNFSTLGTIFNPLGGSHRLGQAEAYKMLEKNRGNPSYKPVGPRATNASYGIDYLIPGVGGIIPGLGRSIGANQVVKQADEEKSAAYYLGFELGYHS